MRIGLPLALLATAGAAAWFSIREGHLQRLAYYAFPPRPSVEVLFAEAVPIPHRVPPGRIARSLGTPGDPAAETLLRPFITQLAPDDPLNIALHCRVKAGALAVQQWLVKESIGTMDFAVATPSGEVFHLTADGGRPHANSLPFFGSASFYFRLDEEELIDPTEPDGRRGAWRAEALPDFTRPGIYEVKVAGHVVLDGAANVPFESETIRIEVGQPELKPQASLFTVARQALRDRPIVQHALVARESTDGDRIFRFRGKLVGNRQPLFDVHVHPKGRVLKIVTTTRAFTGAARPYERADPWSRFWPANGD